MTAYFRLFAAIGAALLVTACSGRGGAGDRFLTEDVAVADIEKTVIGTGVLQPSSVIDVGAQASGQIQSLKVEVGDVVRRGQVIAIIDPATQENTLRNAEAALVQAQAGKVSQEANLERAELEYNRQEQLVGRGFTSRANYDSAVASLKSARAQQRSIDAQIKQAEINLDRARVDLGRTTVTAPIDGVVAAVIVREGQTVNAVQTAPTLVRLAKLDVMTVRAQISEADVLDVRAGQPVFFTVLGDPDRRFEATLRGIEPAPENATSNLTGQPNAPVYYSAVFNVPNPDGVLRPGMTAEVNVVLERAQQVLAMPSAGLGPKNPDGSYRVRVLGAAGKAEERKVTIGLDTGVQAQVLSGLSAGDKVIIGDAWDTEVSGMRVSSKGKGKAKSRERN